MVKKKDKVRFGTIVLILLFVGFLVFSCFYLSFQIEQNFVKTSSTTSKISRDDLRFVDVYFELYKFPGCDEVDRGYTGDVSLVYSVDYPNGYNCEFYVNGDKVKLEDGRYIRNIGLFRENVFRITCRDYLDNRVSKTKRLKNYC